MGQYYVVANITKQEYLEPHDFGDGVKLMEFASSSRGTLRGLAVLLASGNGLGGGDLRSSHPLVGSWAGDRIVIAGDYDPRTDYVDGVTDGSNLYAVCTDRFTNISDEVTRLLLDAGE